MPFIRRMLALILALFLLCCWLPHHACADPLPPPTFVLAKSGAGSAPANFSGPTCITSDAKGRFYVAHTGANPKVVVFDRYWNYQDSIPFSVSGTYNIGPDAVAVTADTSLWILDLGGFLQRWKDGIYRGELRTCDLGGSLPGASLLKLAASPQYLFLGATEIDCINEPYNGGVGIARLDSSGSILGRFHTKWHTNECPGNIQAMAADINDNVYIITDYSLSATCSSGATRYTDLRKYSSSGTKLQYWSLPNGPNYTGLAVDQAGVIYYTSSNDAIDIIAADTLETTFHYTGGGPTATLLNPLALHLGSGSRLYVTDERDRVVTLRVDADDDGISDSWERDGMLVRGGGPRLLLDDPHVFAKDIYVEFDCMDSVMFDTTFALPKVRSMFDDHGTYFHGQMNEIGLASVAWTDSLQFRYQRFREDHFGFPDDTEGVKEAKRLFYRYCVFGDTAVHNGKTIGGAGQIGGNRLLVTQGKQRRRFPSRKVPWNYQVGVFLHELGHTLNLRHGGVDNLMNKPNYISTMNYVWTQPAEWSKTFWKPLYSGQTLGTLRETHLVDSVEVGTNDVPIIPVEEQLVVHGHGGATTEYRYVNGRGMADWNGDAVANWCDGCDINTLKFGVIGSASDTLIGCNDWAQMRVAWIDTTNAAFGDFTADDLDAETSEDDLIARSSIMTDCNINDIADADEVISGVALDVDHNGVLDECEPSRLSGLAERIYACPGGDRDTLKCEIDLEGVYIAGSGNIEHIRIDSLTAGVSLWSRGVRSVSTVGDTLHIERDYHPVTDRLTAFVNVPHLSGCGNLVFSVFTGDSVVVRNLRTTIVSVDQDTFAVGAVERFDRGLLKAALGQTAPCWDVDGSGSTVNGADTTAFDSHLLHHVPRQLLTPNGGEFFDPGDTVHFAWRQALGDSARVTLRIIRDSSSDTVTVVSDTLDTGLYNWVVPNSLAANTGHRAEVMHTAGYYLVTRTHIGTERSDTTFVVRPRPVADLSASAGRSTFAVGWTEPGQGSGAGDEYDVRCMVNTPITELNFGSAKGLKYLTTPGPQFTVHCKDSMSTGSCKTFYFAVRTRDNGVWSLLSNVASASTHCSGSQQVLCMEEGLMAGGGGGEEGLRSVELASMQAHARRQHEESAPSNSLLPGGLQGERLDHFRLSEAPAVQDGAYQVILHQTGGREVTVRQLGLGFVDHPEGTLAVSSNGGVLVGTEGEAVSVIGSRVGGGSDLVSGEGEAHRTVAGETVLVELGEGEDVALLLDVRGELRGGSEDSVGILVQRPGPDSTWTTIETVYPRRQFAVAGVATAGSSLLRLVFLRDYDIRSLRKLSAASQSELQPLTVLGSMHSRLGEAADSVSLVPGDSLRVRFTQSETGAATRDYFLTVRGQYRVAESDAEAGTAELTASSAQILSFALGAARPNPSSGSVVIGYTLARDVETELRIFDVAGREVRTLVRGDQTAGAREAVWDGRDAHGRKVSSGVYFYRLRAGDWQSERKLIVLQ